MSAKRLAVFLSGKGTNADVLVKRFPIGGYDLEVYMRVLNSPDDSFTSFVRKSILDSIFANWAFEEDPSLVLHTLERYGIDWIILAGFLRKLHPTIIKKYHKRILNIHPSLLPRHGGKCMYGMNVHQAVIDSGDKESGITVHYVDDEYDTGDIVFQKKFSLDILSERTAECLQKHVQKLEHEHYWQIIKQEVLRGN